MTVEAEGRAFQCIKDKDKANLKEIIQILKSQGIDVYISGSAMMVPEYSDIDLLICDPSFVFNRVDDEKDFELSPRAQTAIDTMIKQEDVSLRRKNHEYSGGYAGSVICGYRWEFNYKGTRIDISYAQEPGGLTREKIAKLEQEFGGKLDMEPEYEKF